MFMNAIVRGDRYFRKYNERLFIMNVKDNTTFTNTTYAPSGALKGFTCPGYQGFGQYWIQNTSLC